VDRVRLAMMVGFLESLGWSIHYTYSRAWVRDTLGDDYGFILILAAAETLPVILSLLGGMHGDVAGRRIIALLSTLQAPLFASIPLLGLSRLPLIITACSALWAYFWPNIVAPVMEETGRSGSGYARFAIGSTAGWGAGGLTAMLLGALGSTGPVEAYVPAGISLAAAGLLGVRVVEASTPRASLAEVAGFMRRSGRGLLYFFLSLVALQGASEVFWNTSSLKLYGETGSLALFSLLYSVAPTLIGVAARPLAGRAVDQAGAWRALWAVIASYAALYAAIYLATGPLLYLLWIIPIYVFYDTSAYTLSSRLFPEEMQGSASGLVVLAYSAAGLAALLLSQASPSYLGSILAAEFLALLSASALLAAKRIVHGG
jgi:hypothetical protein